MQEQDEKRGERRKFLEELALAVVFAVALTLMLRNWAWMLEL